MQCNMSGSEKTNIYNGDVILVNKGYLDVI